MNRSQHVNNKNQNTSSILQIPFISDTFTYRIQRAIHQSGLNILLRIRPGLQLRQAVKKLKNNRHCEKRNCPINADNMYN
jgi:hypothetical protein